MQVIEDAWSGEDDRFDVEHLEHIDDLPALTALHVECAQPGIDLGPLRALSRLTVLELSSQTESLDPLLDLPALRSVRLGYDDTPENRGIAAELILRGIAVERIPGG
jgi:hypothetical protein